MGSCLEIHQKRPLIKQIIQIHPQRERWSALREGKHWQNQRNAIRRNNPYLRVDEVEALYYPRMSADREIHIYIYTYALVLMCGLLCGTFDTKETFLENYKTDECEESCVQIARQRALLPHIKGYRLRQGVIMSCVYLYLYSVCGLYVPLLIRRQRGLGVGWGELCCFSSFCQRQVARDRDIK